MKSLFHKLMNLGAGILFALLLTTFALSSEPIEGVVREEGTSKPVPDAIVVARWSGHLATFAHGRTVCYHVESTITDGQGRYRIPAWKMKVAEDWQKNIRPETVIVTAHKLGYESHSPPGYTRSKEFKQNVRYLKVFTGGRGERLRYLQRVNSATACGSAGESKMSLLPLAKALYEEAIGLAGTEDEMKIVNNLRFSMEIIDLGYETAERRDIERRRGQVKPRPDHSFR